LDRATRERKWVQMLSNVTSKTYEDLKREAGNRTGWLNRDTRVAEEIAINLPLRVEDRKKKAILR